PAYLEGRMANLRRAANEGRVAPRGGVERVVRQLDELLAQPNDIWALMKPAKDEHPTWSDGDRQALREGVTRAMTAIRTAFERYRALLRDDVLPRSRDDEHVGLKFVEGGVACYDRLIKVHTSLDLGADEIHRIG